MKGYHIKKIYLISCEKCNEDITRTISGTEPETRADADRMALDHERVWHAKP